MVRKRTPNYIDRPYGQPSPRRETAGEPRVRPRTGQQPTAQPRTTARPQTAGRSQTLPQTEGGRTAARQQVPRPQSQSTRTQAPRQQGPRPQSQTLRQQGAPRQQASRQQPPLPQGSRQQSQTLRQQTPRQQTGRAQTSRPQTPRQQGPSRPPANRNPRSSAPQKKGNGKRILLFALIVLIVAALAVAGVFIVKKIQYNNDPAVIAEREAAAAAAEAEALRHADTRVSFLAVGDNLPDDAIGKWADKQAGKMNDGEYDYTGLYEPIKKYVEAADVAYVKQETHIGGDEFGPQGYPSFNTTDEMADAIVATGFDLVASASNHSYDWGYYGANDHSCKVWKEQPVVFTGTASNQEDADKIATIEVNGMVIALLDYTYGVNGYKKSDLKPYVVNFMSEERIKTDVARAKEIADCVVVAMHWGTENQTDPDEKQLKYAKLLADLDVDVVLGSHPHVIGPLAWVEGASGHKTLVAYSLGNFISRHETPGAINELEGMVTFDIVRTDGVITIENVVWVPLVNHTTKTDHAVYAVKDYTKELASKHVVFKDEKDPIGWLKKKTAEVVNSQGDTFTIDDGSNS